MSTAYARQVPYTDRRASYHHGALREELITACVTLIEAEGIGAVSLRRVARAAGVSPGAPYHHFADRSALLAAISVRGHELLVERMRQARQEAPTAVLALGALVETYVRFARDHSAYLHLMLRSDLCQPHEHPEAQTAGESAIQLLTETVADCQREGTAPSGDPGPVAMVWALAIGIVTLWLNGPLEARCAADGTTPEGLTAQITALLESMLAGAPQPSDVDAARS
jgi:AcrR family transcriptional regulator